MAASRMSPSRWLPRAMARRTTFSLGVLAGVLFSTSTIAPSSADPQRAAIAGELPAAFAKTVPSSLEDLQEIEDHVTALISEVKPATVGIRVGNAFGSGVIISSDGYVLTAGHVSGAPNRRATIIMADGRRLKATTLGQNRRADSGLVKIDGDRDDWPFAEMAPGRETNRGDWCAVLGHPGGVKRGRDAVLRLGRVLHTGNSLMQTDCELVGGDSGGPLFDMRGRVIGINSRIAERDDMNFHVPVALYHDEWDRLVAGESYVVHSGARLGVSGERGPDGYGLQVTEVFESEPAAGAGIEVGDLILRFQGERVNSIGDLRELVGAQRPGRRVVLEVERNGTERTVRLRLGSSK